MVLLVGYVSNPMQSRLCVRTDCTPQRRLPGGSELKYQSGLTKMEIITVCKAHTHKF